MIVLIYQWTLHLEEESYKPIVVRLKIVWKVNEKSLRQRSQTQVLDTLIPVWTYKRKGQRRIEPDPCQPRLPWHLQQNHCAEKT
jgi:hypothetical protein